MVIYKTLTCVHPHKQAEIRDVVNGVLEHIITAIVQANAEYIVH